MHGKAVPPAFRSGVVARSDWPHQAHAERRIESLCASLARASREWTLEFMPTTASRKPHTPALRVPADLFRAMGVLYVRQVPGASYEALARRLQTDLNGDGVRYHVRTLKRHLRGQVATVPPRVEAALAAVLAADEHLRTLAETRQLVQDAVHATNPATCRGEYVTSGRLTPLVELWLLLNPRRTRRFLANTLASRLARCEHTLHLGQLQRILAGRQPSVRREVLEQMVGLLAQHGIATEQQASARWQRHEKHIARFLHQRDLEPPHRFRRLASAWKSHSHEPSSRKLAAVLQSHLGQAGLSVGQDQIQAALDGRTDRVRVELTFAMEETLRAALPKGCDLEQVLVNGAAHRGCTDDARWVETDRVASEARIWLARHPESSMRQLCLRVAKTAQGWGYRTTLSTVQPILAGRTRRTRAFVLRALLEQQESEHSHISATRVSAIRQSAVKREAPTDRPLQRIQERPAPVLLPPSAVKYCGPPRRLTRTEESALVHQLRESEQRAFQVLLRSSVVAREFERVRSHLEDGRLRPSSVLIDAAARDDHGEGELQAVLIRTFQRAASIEARCTPYRAVLLTPDVSEERAAPALVVLEALWRELEVVFSDTRFPPKYVKTIGSRFTQLAQAALAVVEDDARLARMSTVRRVELQLGLPIAQIRRACQELQVANLQAEAARDALVGAHQRLVRVIARRYRWTTLELSDLVAEGNLGLLHSLDKYDLDRGCRLSTYASWWIRSSIERFIDMMGQDVRLPLHLADRLRRLHRAERCEYVQHGSTSDLEEMARNVGIRPEQVEPLTLLERGTTSLHSPLGESGATLETFLRDTRSLSPSDATARHELASVIDQALSRLDAREALVLRLRYGLEDERGHTLAEVGAALGVSRERVRQIEAKALERLRHTPAARVLSEFLDPDTPRAA